jgi:hypothetical protein
LQIEDFADRVVRGDRASDLRGPRILETLEAAARSLSEKKLTAPENAKYVEETLENVLKKRLNSRREMNVSQELNADNKKPLGR